MRKFYIPNKKLVIVTISVSSFLLLVLFIRSVQHYPFWWWFMPYERNLCDNGSDNRVDSSHLRCHYVIRDYLYRYKIEELHKNPDLVTIHQLVFDVREVDWIIHYTRKYSDPSPVYTLLTDSEIEKYVMRILDFRTSNSLTIAPWEFTVSSLFAVADRAAGLNVSNLDGYLDILWYRKYGHIIPHHDVYPYSDSVEDGRRFATMIVYFYEPEDGGATIFPKLGIAAKPKAGDAILWYNVKVNNEPDPLLDHAGCPLWKGEKFIGTFWFRQFHQEFRKPCPLTGQRFSFN